MEGDMKRTPKKRMPEQSGDMLGGFFEWLNSEHGEKSEIAMEAVNEALERATLDVKQRKIVFADGKKMTLEQAAKKIETTSKAGLREITQHIIGWMQMDYVPEGLTEKQMEKFEDQMEQWTEPYESSQL
jgi:hypothetical protein